MVDICWAVRIWRCDEDADDAGGAVDGFGGRHLAVVVAVAARVRSFGISVVQALEEFVGSIIECAGAAMSWMVVSHGTSVLG